MRIHAALLLASALVQPLLTAQPKVCMGGDIEHLNAAEAAACSSAVRSVRAQSAAVEASGDWHIVVVCGSTGWQQYAEFAEGGESVLHKAIDTDVAERTTFVNAAALSTADMPSLLEAAATSLKQPGTLPELVATR